METREKRHEKRYQENEKMPQTKDVTDEIAVKSIEPDSILDSAKTCADQRFCKSGGTAQRSDSDHSQISSVSGYFHGGKSISDRSGST